MMLWQVSAGLLTAAGAAAIYLAAPQQRLLRPLPARFRLRVVGVLSLLAGVVLWMQALQPVAGFFSALALLMTIWIALPYLAAWRQTRRLGVSRREQD